MSRRVSSSRPSDVWPAHLRLIVLASERECPPGHARALTDLLSVAMTKVPARGIFDPTSRGEHDLFADIDAIASQHLGMTAARSGWRRALRGARLDLTTRDKVEHAAMRVQGVSDTAYFYAGLAFGLAGVSVYGHRF